MTDSLLVRGRWVIAGPGPADPVLSDGAVLVAGDRIREVGDWRGLRERHPGATVLGSDSVAVLPGLINAHHHSAGVTALQHGVPDRLLELWLLSLDSRRPTDIYLDTLLSAARLLRSGVTTVVDVHGGGGTADDYADAMRRALAAYDEAGLRVAFAAGISDQSHLVWGPRGEEERFLASLPAELRAYAEQQLPPPNAIDQDEYFAVMETFWKTYRAHPRIDLWFAPPGPQWVSDGFMQRIAQQAETYDTGIQTHLTESLYEKLYGPKFLGRPTLLHLRNLGVLSPRFSIAHGVWLTEPEIEVLSESGAAISHNPGSNLRLRAGIAPLNALLASGSTVALGMDGTTLDDDEDMFAEMRLALRLHRTPQMKTAAPQPTDLFAMATTGGAKLLRKEGLLGRLAPDHAADILLLDLERLTWPWVAPETDPRDLILLRARASDVRTVLVGGEVMLQDGRPTRFDAEAAGRELAAQLTVAPYPAEAAKRVEALLPYIEAHYAAWEIPELLPYIRYNSRR
ncbi:amidohydrolase family protein [Rhodospirillaceae bacterium SYSU D60014]|uniref:amidohydrolase family protein n=1 Tax=Virgifigura deserti TaxID=2268457 RepID=UPI000E6620C4